MKLKPAAPTREAINGRIDKVDEWLSNPTCKKEFFELLGWIRAAERERCAVLCASDQAEGDTDLAAFLIRGLT